MRKIERTSQFRRDYKRISANPRYRNVDFLIDSITTLLANDQPLPPNKRDHVLIGSGLRECHLRSDLLLIYDKPVSAVLTLVRLGSHSELHR